ncbi:MAG: serine acetyltransferase [Bacteroidales bacterium]|nr:serine acetyltransferase [Bacteroidales bacterium]
MKAMDATPIYTDHYYKRKAVFDMERPVNENDIVFLGNSLTEGGKWETYFPDIQKALEKKGGAILNRGIVGDTFGGIDARLDQILPGHPKTIFFLTGANDVSHNLTADSIANGIINVVRRIKKESPKTKIYLQSLLPINESFKRYRLLNGKTAMFSEINAKLEKMAKEEKVTFINLYPLMLTNGPADLALPASEQVLRPEITRDGLHITQEGYKIWADAIRKYVK